MSQHPSLRVDSVGVKHRNVLKRYERIKRMQAEDRWGDRSTALNLPKLKSIKVKVKKTKEVPAEGAAAATPGAAPAAAAKAPAAPKADKAKK
jgi:small basic protein (TIGR04137 family)